MASAEEYAQWIVSNQDKKGSPEFDTVAQAYKLSREGATVASKPDSVIKPEVSTAEKITGNPVTRFALGAASPVLGAAQLMANVPTPFNPLGVMNPIMAMNAQRINEHLKQLEQMKERGMEAAGNKGFDFYGMAGSVLNPALAAMGKAAPVANTIGQRMVQGATIGGAAGATAPVTSDGDFAQQKGIQTALGATFGASLPPLINALKSVGGTIRDVSDLILPNGAQRIFERYQNKILEQSEPVRNQIISALRSAQEYVQGSKPTAAEALASVPQASPILSHQGIVSATPGGPSGQFGQRIADQEAARTAALSTIAKTPQELEQAIRDRSRSAAENYGAIEGRLISPKSDTELMGDAIANRYSSKASALQDQGRFQTFGAQQENLSNRFYPAEGQPRLAARYAPQTENIAPAARASEEAGWIARYRQNEKEFLENTLDNLKNTVGVSDQSLTSLLNRPSMREAVKDAVTSAAETNAYFPQAGEKFSVRNLQRIKESLDANIRAASNAEKSGKRPELSVSELEGTRQAFVKWLSNRVPEWRDARFQYAEDSKAIDRMKVGQSLMDKLVSATGKETPSTYANAVRNEAQSIKRATGEPRYDQLNQLLIPKEMETVNNVLSDVSRSARAFNQPQRTNLYGGVNVAEETTPRLPNLLSLWATIANKGLKVAGAGVEKKIDQLAAEAYLNPNKLADILEKIPKNQQNKLTQLLNSYQAQSVPFYAAQQGQ